MRRNPHRTKTHHIKMSAKQGKFTTRYERAEKISQIDWARLAAFIDGEGCIFINSRNAQCKRPVTALYVRISNTNPKLMEWLGKTFGGSVYANPQKAKAWSVPYGWIVGNKTAAWVLEGCKEFMIIKRDQAEIGLAHQRLVFHPKGKRQGHPESNVADRLRLRDELSMTKSNFARRKDLRVIEEAS